MKNNRDNKAGSVSGEPIYCSMCRHFSYFDNKAGHNSAQSLGRCAVESWDGNRGQWALFPHHCRNFESTVNENE